LGIGTGGHIARALTAASGVVFDHREGTNVERAFTLAEVGDQGLGVRAGGDLGAFTLASFFVENLGGSADLGDGTAAFAQEGAPLLALSTLLGRAAAAFTCIRLLSLGEQALDGGTAAGTGSGVQNLRARAGHIRGARSLVGRAINSLR